MRVGYGISSGWRKFCAKPWRQSSGYRRMCNTVRLLWRTPPPCSAGRIASCAARSYSTAGSPACWWRIPWEDRRNWCPDREATLLASAQRLYRKAGQRLARLEELEDELRELEELDLVRSPSPVGPAGSQPLQLRGIRLLVGRNNRQNDRISIQGGWRLVSVGRGAAKPWPW